MVRLIKHDRPRTRNYLSRREQWRLLLLIVPLGLVMIVIARLRNPDAARAINNLFADASIPKSGPQGPSSETPVPAGAFRSASKEPQRPPATAASDNPSRGSGLFHGVQAEWLKSIHDNTYFRNSEKDAWFHFFEALQRAPDAQVESAHSIEATYVQLVDQPDFYRGKLVTVYGYVRQVTEQTPAPNDLGIKSYFRIVVQPTDGSYWPIFVYCLKLPPDLSIGESAAGGNMKVKGLFFKELSYPWRNGLGTAPVIVAKTIEYHGAAPCGPGMADIHPPAAADAWADANVAAAPSANNTPAVEARRESTSFRAILNLAGWDVKQLAALDDGKPLSEAQRIKALELLRRIRSFGSGSLELWVHAGLDPYTMLTNPDDYRGQLVRLEGRVTKVTKHVPDAADAERLEMSEYFDCRLVLNKQAGTATVLTTRVPQAWLGADKLDEPASAVALHLKRTAAGEPPPAIWLAKEIAWHPGKQANDDSPLGPGVGELFHGKADKSFGKALLGSIGMDVGLLDMIQSRGPIRVEERDAFYKMLQSVGEVGEQQLVQFAQQNLPAVRHDWELQGQAATTRPRHLLAIEAVRRAAAGRYSVAPLFNDAERQIGRLFVFDGSARRAVRVETGSQAEGDRGEIASRFGIDHYYELEVFTDDSQNYPLVFCVRELPEGFPVGDSIHEPVRVAGFFFKDWLYGTRGGGEDRNAAHTTGDADRARFAPLLIGRAPIVLEPEQGGAGVAQYVAGAVFVMALAGVWAAAVIYARGDRRFRQRTLAERFSIPAGQSLNDINLQDRR